MTDMKKVKNLVHCWDWV